MKVLMINVVCGIKSTGRICTDLAVALEERGHNVKIGYGRENVPEQYEKYAVKIDSDLDVKLHGVKARLLDADGLGSKRATRKFLKWVEEYNPDIIHLHNLHGYYINVPMLFEYIIHYQKKVIWTLHDCWCFTGHSGTCDQVGCEKWVIGCENCPLSKGYPAAYIDCSKRNYEWKKKLFTSVQDLTIVTPSKWLAGLVKRSFLKDKNILVIPNGIDIKQFSPLLNDFRDVNQIGDKIMILGCASAWGKSKGLDDFKFLAEKLDERFKIVLVGLTKEQIVTMPSSIICIERTQSVKELAQIYSAADLFVNLTYADNYPTVNLEALSCGTPVLTYKTGGSSECLNKNNGIAFERGDLEGVVKFLLTKYKKGMFDVKNSRNSSAINKENSVNEYAKTYKKIGGLFAGVDGRERLEGMVSGGGGGYFKNRHIYAVSGSIMVLGVSAAWGERKGIDVFNRLANDLPADYKIFMVGITKNLRLKINNRIHIIERTNNTDELRRLYSIADVFLNPTIQDNYPTVNLEAVACDTPVITYQTGGSPENSFTPTCVAKQRDYEALRDMLISHKFENALNLSNRYEISKECMMEQYCGIYSVLNH